jgi:hypothetical protein
MRREYRNTAKVEWMGNHFFFSHGDVVVTGMVGGSTGPAHSEKVRRGRSTVGAKLEVNHAISGL